MNWITTRNYGFSDAADLFVFISGYTASFVYARMMLDRGFIVGATRLTKRVWQLYVAHIVLLIYIASISYLALRFGDSELVNEFNVVGLIDNATETLRQGLFHGIQAGQSRRAAALHRADGAVPAGAVADAAPANWTMVAAIVLWLVSRQTGWNLTAYPDGTWYFNPFAWQVLFIFGAWCALGGARQSASVIMRSDALVQRRLHDPGVVMTMAGKFPASASMFPHWLYSTFNPNDKTNLAPYRFLHFVVIVILVIRFVPKDWPGWSGRYSIRW